MQYSLKTLLVFFFVLATAVGAFGPWGFLVAIVCVVAIIGCVTFRDCGCLLGIFLAIVFLTVILLPAVSTPREVARRNSCMHNLKDIGLALHNYHNDYGCFPPAYVTDNNGKRIHSWRTLILPFLDTGSPQRQYDFREPWDGPNNIQVGTNDYLSYFHCPSDESTDKTRTSYVAVTGPGTAWPGERGCKLNEIRDGTSRTVLLVELADSHIGWTEPCDITLAELLGDSGGEAQLPKSNHQGSDYFLRYPPIAMVLLADGSVEILPQRMSRDDLAALFSINGGETIDLERLRSASELPLAQRFHWDHCVGLPLFFVSLLWFWLCVRADRKKAIASTSYKPRRPNPHPSPDIYHEGHEEHEG